MKKRVAALQMTSKDSVSVNLKTAERLIREAAALGASLLLLPENVAFMGQDEKDKLLIAEAPLHGPIQNFFAKLAHELKIWLIGGTIPIKTDAANRVHAACWVWDDRGQVVARYDKMHLFDVQLQSEQTEQTYAESKTIQPGHELVCFDSPLGKIGLSICYDLRFPELYRKLLSAGAEILVVPSAFTASTGQAHWETLLRARAIENLSYVIAADQVGTHPNHRSTWGHSMIIDPWGKILAELLEGEGVIVADIDLDYLNDIRRRFPATEHRRIFE